MAYFGSRIVFDNLGETLSGIVQGKSASDIEERFFRALAKLPDWSATFRQRISPLTHKVSGVIRNLPGELEIDALCTRGNTVLPILIQGEIGHFYAAWQRTVDEQKKSAIDQAMRSYNAIPALWLPSNKDDLWRLGNQASADIYVKEVLSAL